MDMENEKWGTLKKIAVSIGALIGLAVLITSIIVFVNISRGLPPFGGPGLTGTAFPLYGCESASLNEEQVHTCPCLTGQNIVRGDIQVNQASGVHQANSISYPAGAQVVSNSIVFRIKRSDEPGLDTNLLEFDLPGGSELGGYSVYMNHKSGRLYLLKKGSFSPDFGLQTTKGDILDTGPQYAFVCSNYKGNVVVSMFYYSQPSGGWALIYRANNPFGFNQIMGLNGFRYRNSPEYSGIVFQSMRQCIHTA